MKISACFLLIISILASCESPKEKPSFKQPIAKDTAIPTVGKKESSQSWFKTHLHDTTYVEGSCILFLRPNDSRYAELDGTAEGLGDTDSDFGVGVNSTLGSLKKNSDYKEIKGLLSQNRFIYIKDCLGGPLVIDRDTVNYGFITSAKGKHIAKVYNSVHMRDYNKVRRGDYMEEIDSYFLGKGI